MKSNRLTVSIDYAGQGVKALSISHANKPVVIAMSSTSRHDGRFDILVERVVSALDDGYITADNYRSVRAGHVRDGVHVYIGDLEYVPD